MVTLESHSLQELAEMLRSHAQQANHEYRACGSTSLLGSRLKIICSLALEIERQLGAAPPRAVSAVPPNAWPNVTRIAEHLASKLRRAS